MAIAKDDFSIKMHSLTEHDVKVASYMSVHVDEHYD